MKTTRKRKPVKAERKEHDAFRKTRESLFYRPFIQLDCVMTQRLVSEQTFAGNPVVVGDVGVRTGFDPLWDIYQNQCVLVGFDPDRKECAQLKRKYKKTGNGRSPDIRIESRALWNREGRIPFHITRDPNTASCFLPNNDFFRRLPDSSPMDVLRTIEIPTTTIDRYRQKTGIDFDLLKIDVQGGELEILEGALRQLHSSILAVVTEVEFVSLYKGQNLFADIDMFMRENGFALFDLDIRRWRRKPMTGMFDGIRVGQTIYADALYIWDPVEQGVQTGRDDLKISKLVKLASLAECFSLPDFAMEILSVARKRGLINKKREGELFRLLESNTIVARNDRNRIT